MAYDIFLSTFIMRRRTVVAHRYSFHKVIALHLSFGFYNYPYRTPVNEFTDACTIIEHAQLLSLYFRVTQAFY